MDRDTFIITVYCLVVELDDEVTQQRPIRHGGFAPELTDAAVMTRESCGEYLNPAPATDLFAYFPTPYRHFFARLTDRRLFGRQAASLWQIKAASQQRLVLRSGPAHEPGPPLDTLPRPVCVYTRAPRARCVKPEADYGPCAAKKLDYDGFKLGRRLARGGMLTHYPLLAARPHAINHLDARVEGFRGLVPFGGFYKTLRNALAYPHQNSLVFRCAHVPSTGATKVENQIPHWIFAMHDTLAVNTICALALIASHPDKEGRIRKEMEQVDWSSVQGIDQLKYLEGCVQEAMRIWPSTPLLIRETVREDILAGKVIPAKTQVLILNSFNHRDREAHAFADSFSPEVWLDNPLDYHFNHLSNGAQVCAGKDLALFIAKAVLTNLLARARYTLQKPALDPNKPLPHLYNHFQIHFTRTDR